MKSYAAAFVEARKRKPDDGGAYGPQRKWKRSLMSVNENGAKEPRKVPDRDLRDSWKFLPWKSGTAWFSAVEAGWRLHWHPSMLEHLVFNSLCVDGRLRLSKLEPSPGWKPSRLHVSGVIFSCSWSYATCVVA